MAYLRAFKVIFIPSVENLKKSSFWQKTKSWLGDFYKLKCGFHRASILSSKLNVDK